MRYLVMDIVTTILAAVFALWSLVELVRGAGDSLQMLIIALLFWIVSEQAALRVRMGNA